MNPKSILILLIVCYLSVRCQSNNELLLDNMVVLEKQIQQINLVQLDRGNAFEMDIKAEYFTTPHNPENQAKLAKLQYVMNKLDEIDIETALIIALTEKYKHALLKQAGENLQESNRMDNAYVVWQKYDPKNRISPSRLNLSALKHKDDAATVTNYFVESGQLGSPGLELWKALNNYRSSLVRITGSYVSGESTFEINPKAINAFASNKDLASQVQDMVASSNANLKEDAQVLVDIYMCLTKPEISKGNQHWITATFKDSPLINALASLSSLQQDILSARAIALAQWRSKIGGEDYGFTSIIPIANGPAFARNGEEVQIKVLIAAFDAYNQPVVSVDNAHSTITVADGIGWVTVKPKTGINHYKGKITIKNKSGVAKTENWEWTIHGK